jgi:hypothetical protein
MGTARLVKWSKEAKEFFDNAKDSSIVLDLVISYACASQTGEGFEELVNTINSKNIKRKIKKVIITDTSYLYRHMIPSFSGYCDNKITTEWYLKNKESIEKLKVDKEVISWFTGLEKSGFKDWHKQIKKDFVRDSNFKNAVIEIANTMLLKSDETRGEGGGGVDR